MYALIKDNRVVQLSDTTFDVHNDLIWVKITDQLVDVGWEYDGNTFSEPPGATPTKKEIEFSVRHYRNSLLKKTDWMALSDVSITQEWKTYRQALRDITEQSGFPDSIEWPTAPNEETE